MTFEPRWDRWDDVHKRFRLEYEREYKKTLLETLPDLSDEERERLTKESADKVDFKRFHNTIPILAQARSDAYQYVEEEMHRRAKAHPAGLTLQHHEESSSTEEEDIVEVETPQEEETMTVEPSAQAEEPTPKPEVERMGSPTVDDEKLNRAWERAFAKQRAVLDERYVSIPALEQFVKKVDEKLDQNDKRLETTEGRLDTLEPRVRTAEEMSRANNEWIETGFRENLTATMNDYNDRVVMPAIKDVQQTAETAFSSARTANNIASAAKDTADAALTTASNATTAANEANDTSKSALQTAQNAEGLIQDHRLFVTRTILEPFWLVPVGFAIGLVIAFFVYFGNVPIILGPMANFWYWPLIGVVIALAIAGVLALSRLGRNRTENTQRTSRFRFRGND